MAAIALFRLFAIGLALAAGRTAAPPPAAAQTAGDQRIAFDIPAQPLDAALTQYFRATGVQLLYDSELTAGRRSSAVRGNYAPREALALLLRGTGLVARYSRASAAILTTPESPSKAPLVPLGRVVVREKPAPPRLDAVARLAFYGRLETELQALLQNHRRTRQMPFAVTLSLRIAPGGAIVDLRITRGTGDPAKDAAIADALRGRAVTPPPDGLVQPLIIALNGRRQRGE